jgi:hypothetical protein
MTDELTDEEALVLYDRMRELQRHRRDEAGRKWTAAQRHSSKAVQDVEAAKKELAFEESRTQ